MHINLPSIARLRPRSGYDVVAVLALCTALGTGGAYAAATIGGADVVDESLTDADINDGSLAASIGVGAVNATKLGYASVTSAKIASAAVQGGAGGDVLDNSITGDDIDESTLSGVGIGGVETFTGHSDDDSESPKTAFAHCPAGKTILSTGYRVDGAGARAGSEGNVTSNVDVHSVTQYDLPHSSTSGGYVAVTAFEDEPTNNSWEIVAFARCANAE